MQMRYKHSLLQTGVREMVAQFLEMSDACTLPAAPMPLLALCSSIPCPGAALCMVLPQSSRVAGACGLVVVACMQGAGWKHVLPFGEGVAALCQHIMKNVVCHRGGYIRSCFSWCLGSLWCCFASLTKKILLWAVCGLQDALTNRFGAGATCPCYNWL